MALEGLEKYKQSTYACQRCAWCRVATYHDKGMERICPIWEHDEANRWEHSYSRGHVAIIRALMEEKIEFTPEVAETFYRCTLCGNCEAVCSTNVAYEYGYQPEKMMEHVNIFEKVREEAVKLGIARNDIPGNTRSSHS